MPWTDRYSDRDSVINHYNEAETALSARALNADESTKTETANLSTELLAGRLRRSGMGVGQGGSAGSSPAGTGKLRRGRYSGTFD